MVIRLGDGPSYDAAPVPVHDVRDVAPPARLVTGCARL